jgi:hypothetical protein
MLSLLVVAAFISSLAASPGALGGQEPPAPLPVTVPDDGVRIREGQLSFRLQNRAASPVTAWRVAADYVLDDGTSRRIVYGREGYLAFSGLVPPELAAGRVVQPGGTTDVAIPLPESWPRVSTVRLQVESAIFADGSAFGPQAEVDAIFARRTEDRAAWLRVRAAFDEAKKGGTGDAVARAIDELDFPGDATHRHRVVISARKDLERLLSGAPQTQRADRSLDTVLMEWVRRADAHVAAATRHSARR